MSSRVQFTLSESRQSKVDKFRPEKDELFDALKLPFPLFLVHISRKNLGAAGH